MPPSKASPPWIKDLIERTLLSRSGRVISVGRLVLASVFLTAFWLDPTQPSRSPAEGYMILASYVAVAAILLAVTWHNWWLDRRLALPAHVLDIAVFTVMVSLSEGYTSPFFTFFVFLLLSATIRWGWRETAITAAVVIPLFLAAGVAALVWGGGEFELRRFLIRAAYLLVLSFILIWFGSHKSSAQGWRSADVDPEDAGEATRSLIQRSLELAAERTGAAQVVFAWAEKEEPWLHVASVSAKGFEHRRFGPEEYADLVETRLAQMPFLFDLQAHRVLIYERSGRTRLEKVPNAVAHRFAERYGIGQGMAVPVETVHHAGHLFVLGVPGLSSDLLEWGRKLGADLASSLERLANLKMSDESAAARTRLSLARDLHDNVVQLLAGTSFRLASIRRAAAAQGDVGGKIEALQQELALHQRELREFISRLRSGHGDGEASEICQTFHSLVQRLSRQWGVECVLAECLSPPLSASLEHELHQLTREAVANAVKHGQADRVTIALTATDEAVRLEVHDNGRGFPKLGYFPHEALVAKQMIPWSIGERVRSFGGTVALSSTSDGSTIEVKLALEEPA